MILWLRAVWSSALLLADANAKESLPLSVIKAWSGLPLATLYHSSISPIRTAATFRRSTAERPSRYLPVREECRLALIAFMSLLQSDILLCPICPLNRISSVQCHHCRYMHRLQLRWLLHSRCKEAWCGLPRRPRAPHRGAALWLRGSASSQGVVCDLLARVNV